MSRLIPGECGGDVPKCEHRLGRFVFPLPAPPSNTERMSEGVQTEIQMKLKTGGDTDIAFGANENPHGHMHKVVPPDDPVQPHVRAAYAAGVGVSTLPFSCNLTPGPGVADLYLDLNLLNLDPCAADTTPHNGHEADRTLPSRAHISVPSPASSRSQWCLPADQSPHLVSVANALPAPTGRSGHGHLLIRDSSPIHGRAPPPRSPSAATVAFLALNGAQFPGMIWESSTPLSQYLPLASDATSAPRVSSSSFGKSKRGDRTTPLTYADRQRERRYPRVHPPMPVIRPAPVSPIAQGNHGSAPTPAPAVKCMSTTPAPITGATAALSIPQHASLSPPAPTPAPDAQSTPTLPAVPPILAVGRRRPPPSPLHLSEEAASRVQPPPRSPPHLGPAERQAEPRVSARRNTLPSLRSEAQLSALCRHAGSSCRKAECTFCNPPGPGPDAGSGRDQAMPVRHAHETPPTWTFSTPSSPSTLPPTPHRESTARMGMATYNRQATLAPTFHPHLHTRPDAQANAHANAYPSPSSLPTTGRTSTPRTSWTGPSPHLARRASASAATLPARRASASAAPPGSLSRRMSEADHPGSGYRSPLASGGRGGTTNANGTPRRNHRFATDGTSPQGDLSRHSVGVFHRRRSTPYAIPAPAVRRASLSHLYEARAHTKAVAAAAATATSELNTPSTPTRLLGMHHVHMHAAQAQATATQGPPARSLRRATPTVPGHPPSPLSPGGTPRGPFAAADHAPAFTFPARPGRPGSSPTEDPPTSMRPPWPLAPVPGVVAQTYPQTRRLSVIAAQRKMSAPALRYHPHAGRVYQQQQQQQHQPMDLDLDVAHDAVGLGVEVDTPRVASSVELAPHLSPHPAHAHAVVHPRTGAQAYVLGQRTYPSSPFSATTVPEPSESASTATAALAGIPRSMSMPVLAGFEGSGVWGYATAVPRHP